MKKKFTRILTALLAVMVFFTTIPGIAYANLDVVKSPYKCTTFKSTTSFGDEVLKANIVNDKILRVNYKSVIPAAQYKLNLVGGGSALEDQSINIYVTPEVTTSGAKTFYFFTKDIDISKYDIADGTYSLIIGRVKELDENGVGNYISAENAYKNLEVNLKSGKLRLLRYKDVIAYNNDIRAIGSKYSVSLFLDTSLSDISFVLRNPATDVTAEFTTYEKSYIKNISDRICKGLTTDYAKLQAIYEYTASNFYYDTIAFQTHSYQFANPFDNMYAFENGQTTANAKDGKVYTTCQGFSAIFLSLARAQDIPTRFVEGHRLSVPNYDWLTESNISERDHWWCESYVNGKWIFIDPTVGTTNKYNSNTGVWTETGLTNYTYFDPTDEQIATSHVYINIYPDYRKGRFITNESEKAQIIAFLEQETTNARSSTYYSAYVKNGIFINDKYVSTDTSTWGDGTLSHFQLDGRGNTERICWSGYDLGGVLNLNKFDALTSLEMHNNRLAAVNLSNNCSLKSVSLSYNKINSLDLSNDTSLQTLQTKENPIHEAVVYLVGDNRSFKVEDHGSFYLTYDKKSEKPLTITSVPDIGYTVKGVYSQRTGALLSSKESYSTYPSASGYIIKFELDPESYEVKVNPGDVLIDNIPYYQAIARRLNELGYYNPANEVGTELSYENKLIIAMGMFQVVNGLDNDAVVDKETWTILFSKDAKPMVSDIEYQQILQKYNEYIVLKAKCKEYISEIKIKAETKASKGSMKVSWTLPDVSDEAFAYVTGYEVYKASSKTGKYTLTYTTSNPKKFTYKNTKGLTKGKRYYYKVRSYYILEGKKIYSDFSNITYKIAK